ncbi:MAG: hypothetical protein B6229_00425 [Spirochaetaceae bacterium 4572_7]|nr:MAG: hypothetical protein B6229_00425 [Spirochaetaceae bacterium 4572_7]
MDRLHTLHTNVCHETYLKYREACDSRGMKMGKQLEKIIKEWIKEDELIRATIIKQSNEFTPKS